MNHSRPILSVFVVLLTCALLEFVTYVALKTWFLPKGYLYIPKLEHTQSSYEHLQKTSTTYPWGIFPLREPIRIKPIRASETRDICVSLYGDSFTADLTWGKIVAEKLGCGVVNYGVGGFGIDQALMRYEHVANDTAGVTVLSFFSEDIARHVTRNFNVWVYQPNRYGSSVYAHKARFILDSDFELKVIPGAVGTFEQFKAAVFEPHKFIEHDYLAGGGGSGPPIFEFPYTIAMAQLLTHWKIKPRFKGKPWYGDLFTQGHDSAALEISVKIVERFVELAHERNTKPVVNILPSVLDLQYFAKNGQWIYQPLIDDLAGNGILAHNIGDEMLRIVKTEDLCSLFEWGTERGMEDCGGHYSVKGYTILGEATAQVLLDSQDHHFNR